MPLLLLSCSGSEFKEYKLEVVAEYPHDTESYTQGLFFEDGQLYESTGLHGKSTFRAVDLQTGNRLQELKIMQLKNANQRLWMLIGIVISVIIIGCISTVLLYQKKKYVKK